MNKLYIGPDKKALSACADYLECEVEALAMKSDVLIISPNEKGKILVEDIQEIYRVSSLATGSEKGRCCILLGFSQATETVQNKLLKVLEDGSMHFFIAASSARYLLDTVKSRCVFEDASFSEQEQQEQYLAPFKSLKNKGQLLSNLHLSKDKDPLNFYEVNKGDIKNAFLQWKRFLYTTFETNSHPIREMFGDASIVVFLEDLDNAVASENFTKDDFFYMVAKFIEGGFSYAI